MLLLPLWISIVNWERILVLQIPFLLQTFLHPENVVAVYETDKFFACIYIYIALTEKYHLEMKMRKLKVRLWESKENNCNNPNTLCRRSIYKAFGQVWTFLVPHPNCHNTAQAVNLIWSSDSKFTISSLIPAYHNKL